MLFDPSFGDLRMLCTTVVAVIAAAVAVVVVAFFLRLVVTGSLVFRLIAVAFGIIIFEEIKDFLR